MGFTAQAGGQCIKRRFSALPTVLNFRKPKTMRANQVERHGLEPGPRIVTSISRPWLDRMARLGNVASETLRLLSPTTAAISMTLLGVNVARAADKSCDLAEVDYAANARLSFDDFDQKGTTPTTWRALSNQGCNEQAAAAAEDYLAHAKLSSVSAEHDVVFHIAQSLALSGHNSEAALLVVAAKDPTQPATADLDWNTYLNGTWGYLRHRRDELEKARSTLSVETGAGNMLNARVLAGLLHCFDQPYSVAYSASCRVP